MRMVDLHRDWQMRYEDLEWGPEMAAMVLNQEDDWIQVHLPCDVHMPLIEKGLMKDPVVADHSLECEWVEDKSWWFKKTFTVDSEMLRADVVELVLESLDAEGHVFLNGASLGHHRSAFYPFQQDVKRWLHPGENILLVRLSSGLEHYSEADITRIKKTVGVENKDNRSDCRRPFVRKPQYAYGWDWGPRVASCGIMKGAYLQAFTNLAVRGVQVHTRSIEGDKARLGFEVEVENLHPFATLESVLSIDIKLDGQKVAELQEEVLLRSGYNFIELEIELAEARLWWPNGMGDQPLYTIEITATTDSEKHAWPSFRYGIRMLRLDMDRLRPGERRFAFEINGVRAFCKGANWIPADSIYARVTAEKYDTLIREAREANFNMLRIWGGGLYEPDVFYEKCDEYGIMIWHDFMFACSMYPDDLDWFRKEVEYEIDYQTRRLRNHPSIVLWSGNNENHWGFHSWWVGDRKASFMGGAIIYNHIIPSIIRRNSPHIPYWNSSPYGGEDPNGNDIGDRHHWGDCTMNPDMEKRITPEEYDKISSKFISEYGYIGPCRKSSIVKYHGGVPLDPKGKIWQMHNNTFEKETVVAGIEKHYGKLDDGDIDQYLLYAGLCQGLMLSYSLEAIRFKEDCSGSLFWMYDDCWGEVGWTIIDYYLKRKLSYYFVKRTFAPIKLIMREVDGKVKVMGINEAPEVYCFDGEYGYISFDGSVRETSMQTFRLEPFSRCTLLEFEKGDQDVKNGVYFIKPISEDQTLLSAVLRTGVFKELLLPEPKVSISDFRLDEDTACFTVCSDDFAHAVHFNLDDSLHLSDEYFDLLPGECRKVQVFKAPEGFAQEDVKLQWVTAL